MSVRPIMHACSLVQPHGPVVRATHSLALPLAPGYSRSALLAASPRLPHSQPALLPPPHPHSHVQHCHKHALHPADAGAREQHLAECALRHERLAARSRSAGVECGICLEAVLGKADPGDRKFGLLTACDHPFCLRCIRSWRQKTDGGADIDTVGGVSGMGGWGMGARVDARQSAGLCSMRDLLRSWVLGRIKQQFCVPAAGPAPERRPPRPVDRCARVRARARMFAPFPPRPGRPCALAPCAAPSPTTWSPAWCGRPAWRRRSA